MGTAAPLVSPDFARVLITGLGVLLGGGGLLKLTLFLLQRRPTLRALDATSDSTLATAMSTFLGEVRVDRAEDREEIKTLKEESRKSQEESRALADEIRELRLKLQAADLAIGAERRSREHMVDELEAIKEDLRQSRLEIDSLHRRLRPLADPVPDVEQILHDNREP